MLYFSNKDESNKRNFLLLSYHKNREYLLYLHNSMFSKHWIKTIFKFKRVELLELRDITGYNSIVVSMIIYKKKTFIVPLYVNLLATTWVRS